tara:strand:+ start:38 stop:1087 length:1050 start_codon:yes stop_codon:yes gene_type:complete
MKNIIVTGGCGFIGSNFIVKHLAKNDNKILNIDNLSYSANLENLLSVDKNSSYHFQRGDIGNNEVISKAFNSFKPHLIINFAAETHVDRSIDDPDKFITTNVLGTLNLLKVSLKYFKTEKDFKFIHVSTDEVYGSLDLKSKPFTELSAYQPNSPYSASKASSDHLVRAWFETYGLPTIITNCTNNYGPYQFPEKLIPLIVANCLGEKPLPIFGDGLQLRDWLFVDDHCSALDLIIKNGKIGSRYIIGSNKERKNIDIVKKICKILDELNPRKNGSYKDLITFVKDRPGHDFRYAIDSSKIHKELNWQPKESFDSGLLKTVKWYVKNQDWWKKIQKNTYKQERLGLKNYE